MNKRPRPLTLIILDGWGHREEKSANAILAAKKPCWDRFWEESPHTFLSGSGQAVGLPVGQMGNSEVGHLTMGAGRVLYQDLTRIDLAIQNGDFLKNKTLIETFTRLKEKNKALHLMGLLSPGGIHSHENHIIAALQLAAKMGLEKVYLHAFLDGRDTPPKSAEDYIKKMEAAMHSNGCGRIVSLIGRYYAMDRDQRYLRIEKAYHLIASGIGDYTASHAIDALHAAYQRNETDEFVKATAIRQSTEEPLVIQDDDAILFMNFRKDRARELTEAFISPVYEHFSRKNHPTLSALVTLTEYDERFHLPIVFLPQTLSLTLAEYLSQHHLTQLHIAETEKYAHVTFFFNGGIEMPYPGEERILIPSPKVATYDLQPEMSAIDLAKRLVSEIESEQYDVIICNFANADMVGHTGQFDATVKAIETLDTCLGLLADALKKVGGEAIITADHGNAECMFDEATGQAHTAHTQELVPFIYLGREARITHTNGTLADIAPTMLYLMDLPQPKEMTGTTLLQLVSSK